MRLRGKVIVIIGGTSGLGLSAAKAFSGEGAQLVIVGRDPHKTEAAARQLGGPTLGFAGDANLPQTAVNAIGAALRQFGGLDGLYHVAGGSGRRHGDGPLHELTDDGWAYTLNENLTSVFYSNRAALKQFLEQKRGGAILNMSSVLGFAPSPQHFNTHAYAASKAGIIGLTKAAAAFYAKDNIRVNVVAPALVSTPMSQRAQADAQILAYIRSKQPLDGGRIGQPSDVDAAAVYFMSDDSKFVTGQVLAVDGGWCVS
jgi:NAD(P)-dependent dehydrogenase (short-subunit alcohol dehydrogenase family)